MPINRLSKPQQAMLVRMYAGLWRLNHPRDAQEDHLWRRTLSSLVRKGLAQKEKDGWILTDAGLDRARSLGEAGVRF